MVFKGNAKELLSVYVGGQLVEATTEHPFWVSGNWIPAILLTRGDSVLLLNGDKGVITMVTHQIKDVNVFNLEVSENHNYYVSSAGVLVHNNCDKGWIKKNLYNTPDSEQKAAFEEALSKGSAAPVRQEGIVQVRNGVLTYKGDHYTYELKTPPGSKLGNQRLYGNIQDVLLPQPKGSSEPVKTQRMVVFEALDKSHQK